MWLSDCPMHIKQRGKGTLKSVIFARCYSLPSVLLIDTSLWKILVRFYSRTSLCSDLNDTFIFALYSYS